MISFNKEMSIPKVLFIKGVFKKDYLNIEQMFEDKLFLESSENGDLSHLYNIKNLYNENEPNYFDKSSNNDMNSNIISTIIRTETDGLAQDVNHTMTQNFRHSQDSNNIKFKPIPSLFHSLETWVNNTNLLCWQCSLNFNGKPIFIPKVIEPVISNSKHTTNYDLYQKNSEDLGIGVHGVFCSFDCAYTFIDTQNLSLTSKIEMGGKLDYLYKLFYKEKYEKRSVLPKYYEMVQYGGSITQDEYKKNIIR